MVAIKVILLGIGTIVMVPFILDIVQKKTLGTNIATLGWGLGTFLGTTGQGARLWGTGVGTGIQEFISRAFSPQIRPAFVPEIGFRLDVPCYGHQMREMPTYDFDYISAVREGRMLNG